MTTQVAYVPRLKQRWPGAAVTAGRAARQMRDAQEILDSAALADSAGNNVSGRVSQAALRELTAARRANLLRYRILELGLAVPSAGQLEKLLATLTPREEQVLRMRFGIGKSTDHTLEEVGRDFSVTRERIRQIEAQALRKLRRPSRSQRLRSFVDGL